MQFTEHFHAKTNDPVLEQAEKIFAQRQSRSLIIDPDILGEPGWDILLCAFIAHHKGTNCSLDEVADKIGLSVSTASRWVDLLALREFLFQKDGFFSISEEAELKLSTMFKKQMIALLQSVEEFGRWPAGSLQSR